MFDELAKIELDRVVTTTEQLLLSLHTIQPESHVHQDVRCATTLTVGIKQHASALQTLAAAQQPYWGLQLPAVSQPAQGRGGTTSVADTCAALKTQLLQ